MNTNPLKIKMPLFLIIDTALEKGTVIVANEDKIIDVCYNEMQNQHAEWLHIAIENTLIKNKFTPKDIDVIAVTEGPGSYTGLRIAMSTAKGLCYALQKPLITISNLLLYAKANSREGNLLYIPMIDARRMEVFITIFDENFKEIADPQSLILNEKSFNDFLQKKLVIFCGNGALKFELICKNTNAIFGKNLYNSINLYDSCKSAYSRKAFANLTYVEPRYVKPFHFIKK
jgi:tRNA threonylcarbamoyladenosine biosynthesis protein TsaB